jgi:hypothetical protein
MAPMTRSARCEITPTAIASARLVRQGRVLDLGRILDGTVRHSRAFLQLTHRGRRSGRLYLTVLEVVRFDPQKQESSFAPSGGYARIGIAI